MKSFSKYIVALAAVIFVAPAVSFAQSGDDEPDVYMGSSLTPAGEDQYVLTLESYLKGEVIKQIVTTHEATEFALTIDMSSSMVKYYQNAGTSRAALNTKYGAMPMVKYSYPERKADGTKRYNDESAYTYQYRAGNSGSWSNIIYKNGAWQTTGGATVPATGNFQVVNYRAVQMAVENFIKAVHDDAVSDVDGDGQPDNVEHKISISIFSADTKNHGDTYSNYGSTETILESASIISDLDDIYDLIEKLGETGSDGYVKYFGRGTHSNLGMELAYETLSASTEKNRIAVLFTDGAPTSPMTSSGANSSDSDNSIYCSDENLPREIVDGCIANAKKIKDLNGMYFDPETGTISSTKVDGYEQITSKVFVVSLGTYSGNSGNVANYLNLTSSNYPDAESFPTTANGKNAHASVITLNPGESDTFYSSAVSSEELNNVFVQIGEEARSTASTKVTEENSYVRGVLTQSFTLPEDMDPEDVKVYTCVATNVTNAGVVTWQNSGSASSYRVVYRDADGKVYDANASGRTREYWKELIVGEDVVLRFDMTDTNQSLEVQGFDFSEHWVGPGSSNGQKLIIQTPVLVKEEAVGGPDVPVITPNSGLYVDPTGTGDGDYDKVEEYPEQKTDVPVKLNISATGLKLGESIIVRIYESNPEATSDSDAEWHPYTNVILTGDADGNASALVKTGRVRIYKLELMDWSWTYGSTINTTNVTTYGVAVNPFTYVNTPYGVKALHAENEVRNDFSKNGSVGDARNIEIEGTSSTGGDIEGGDDEEI